MAKSQEQDLQQKIKETQGQVDKVLESQSSESEVTPVEKKDLPKWNCRVEGTPSDEQWTVGETFGLVCEGPTAEFLSTELTFKEDKKSNYRLQVLSVRKQTENELDMLVTSYVPKPHRFDKLYIQDQKVSVVQVEPFNLIVKSVITNPEQKPYGPAGAVALSFPLWLWITMGSVILVGVFFGLFRMNRRAQMRRVIEELKQHNTALGAFNQFNKDIRTLGRRHIFGDEKGWTEQKKQRYLENLDEVFRMYLLREFYVPALDWNSGLTVRTISKQDKRRFPRYGSELQKFLKELDRAKADAEKLRVHDCQQLTQMAKRVTQAIWKVRKV